MPLKKKFCCCANLDCDGFAACAPGPCIKMPLMTFKREQKHWNSGCTLALRELEFIVRDAILQWDSFSRCYYLQCAEVEVHFREQLWSMFAPWGGQKTFDTSLGECCPDCLSCCRVSDVTFDVAPQPISNGISLCCVSPCGAGSSKDLLRMRFNWVLTGLLETSSLDPATNPGCCGSLVSDGPLSWGMLFYFEAWTPLNCDPGEWFKCRSVNFYGGDLISGDTNGIGWAGGRIPGTTGGRKINRICDGAYEHERPACVVPPGGLSPTEVVLDCLDAGHGTLATHYAVTSCRPTQAWPNTVDDPDAALDLDFSFSCVESPDPCPFKVCGDGRAFTGDGSSCPDYPSSSPCYPGPDPNCDNDTGLAAWAERTDKLESRFDQPVVHACAAECPPGGEP